MLGTTILIIWLGCWVVGLTAFISAVMQPTPRWNAIDKSKAGWLIGMFFLGLFFAVPYLVSVRPKLAAVAAS